MVHLVISGLGAVILFLCGLVLHGLRDDLTALRDKVEANSEDIAWLKAKIGGE